MHGFLLLLGNITQSLLSLNHSSPNHSSLGFLEAGSEMGFDEKDIYQRSTCMGKEGAKMG